MQNNTKKGKAIKQFLKLVQEVLLPSNVLIIYDDYNQKLVQDIYSYNERNPIIPEIKLESLNEISIPSLSKERSIFEYALFFYNIILNEDNKKKWELRQHVCQNMDFIIPVCDMSEIFENFYIVDYHYLSKLQKNIVERGEKAESIKITNSEGTLVHAVANDKFKWTNLDSINPPTMKGKKIFNLLFGEVATFSKHTNGKIAFTGAILAEDQKFDGNNLIQEPLHMILKNGIVTQHFCKNQKLYSLLDAYFSQNELHTHLTEIGISTHNNIDLINKNKFYLERHAGTHLGFGGIKGSHHIDFIFADSVIYFDDQVIFDYEFKIE